MNKTRFCALLAALLAQTALTQGALAQTPALVIDNARVTVRDIVLAPDKPGPVIAHAGDYAVLYLQGGRIRGSDGRTANRPDGGAIFGHGGVTSDTAITAPAHEIVVELKDTPSNTVPNTTGLPPAFPRRGSKMVLENDRMRVWNYAWVPGQPTAMHFHDTEVVVVFRGDGDIASTTQDGKTIVAHHSPGDIVFNTANRSHSEEVVKGAQSGIMLELK
jgi:predicted metal-dependent enzyme (double-stranded beta helix superfamily)